MSRAEILERDWQAQVLQLASYYGWTHFHVLDSRGSDAGWPDLALARPPELVFVELKTDKGALTPAQYDWIERLRGCGQEVLVWRPRDLERVHERLKRGAS